MNNIFKFIIRFLIFLKVFFHIFGAGQILKNSNLNSKRIKI